MPDRTTHRLDIAIGRFAPGDLSAYTCGHCNSELEPLRTDDGIVHLAVLHDNGCPVLTGALSAAPDVARAIQTTEQHPTGDLR